MKKNFRAFLHFAKTHYISLKYRRHITRFSKVLQFLEKNKSTTLFITHNLGGGTEQYVSNFRKEHNLIILRILRDSTWVPYRMETASLSPKENNSCYVSYRQIVRLISSTPPPPFFLKQIVVNSLVQDTILNKKNLISLIIQYKKQNPDCNIVYNLHDFHSICPSIQLIYKNQFCNMENCNNPDCKYNKSIILWRKKWSHLFSVTDSVICFSDSSKSLFLTAYPSVSSKNIMVIPHSMNYSDIRKIVTHNNYINLGIIGHVGSVAKGAIVVKNFLNYCIAHHCQISVHFIGTSEKGIKITHPSVNYHGSYQQKELGKILENYNINVCFFPSIWPETFSYVVSELMQTEIPVVCFDLGAQAEKIKQYNKGVICEDTNPESILNAIIKAHRFNDP